METLDLNIHDPEEFEGKCISYNGCDYEIGPCIGSGSEKIVHKLINRRSKLCLNVLLIFRIPEFAAQELKREVAAKHVADMFGGVDVPDIIGIQAYGGILAIQEYIGPFEEETSSTFSLMKEANSLLSSSDKTQAVSLYQRILDINPDHTVALNNLAYIQANSRDLQAAVTLQSKALEIEPNYLPYHRSYLEYTASCGMLRASINQLEQMKSIFPYAHDSDEVGINLYLETGLPEKAKSLLESPFTVLDKAIKKQLSQTIKTALSAKGRSLAIIQQAKKILLSGQLNGLRELLEQAYAVYDKNPLLSINLGFAVQRAGDYEKARNLLLRVTNIVPFTTIKVCYANAAFGAIAVKDFQGAMKLLEGTMIQLEMENGGNETSNLSELPGVGIWIDEEGILEEPPDTAAQLIKYVVEQHAQQNQVPDLVKRLMLLYNKAATDIGSEH
jgi:tetratricopeptide (TPR) repeat protein